MTTKPKPSDVAHILPALRAHAVRISTLNLDPDNALDHEERDLAATETSLAEFQQHRVAVVQKKGRRVRVGNGMVQALARSGKEWVAAIVVEEDDLRASARAIADNKTGRLAPWNENLAKTLARLGAEAPELAAATGFNDDELATLLTSMSDAGGDVPESYDPPDDPVTRPGDLWVLGRHRPLCGDSSSPGDVDRLLAGEPVHLVNTDPPYNVKVEPRSNNAIAAGLSSFGQNHHQKLAKKAKATGPMRPKDRPLENDFISDEEFARMLRAWFGNASRVLLPGRGFYIWGGYTNIRNYPPAIEEAGLYFSQAIIWDKQHPVLTRKDFMGAHECCLYGWKEGAAHKFYGPNNVPDVWSVKKMTHTKTVHLTEKPVELAERAMMYSSKKGENVLDLFGGSGSTMAAAETQSRRAFLMELDPAYCDVIVDRMTRMGLHPNLDGAAYDEVAKARA